VRLQLRLPLGGLRSALRLGLGEALRVQLGADLADGTAGRARDLGDLLHVLDLQH
jgi:hypothetical protein